MRSRFPVLVVLATAAATAVGCMHRSEHPERRARYSAASDASYSAPARTMTTPPPAPGGMYLKNYGVRRETPAAEDRLSTFAVDVDTGSYTLCRSYLERGSLPPEAAVRTEEFVNYFRYDYPAPRAKGDALGICLEAARSPFRASRVLMRVGLKARDVSREERRPAVLVLVVDTSGSMGLENRLGLVQKSLRLLVEQLTERDAVGLVAYGSEAREVLPVTSLRRRERILKAIDGLAAGGSTNAEAGLRLGYGLLSRAADEVEAEGEAAESPGDIIRRVILLSDGVANVGRTGPEEILDTIRKHVARGVTLSTIGFGMGNYNDVLMERLADQGNGHYAYVDTLDEARRVLVDELTGTLQLAARDAKAQVDFNRDVVRSYRLLGYENRDVADRDFRDDRVDGGEVGAGHSVTAVYEVRLERGAAGRMATVRVRYRPGESRPGRESDDGDTLEVSRQIGTSDVSERFADAPRSLRLAACAAEFAEVLRGSPASRGTAMEDLLDETRGCDRGWGRSDDVKALVALMEKAERLGLGDRAKHDYEEDEDED